MKTSLLLNILVCLQIPSKTSASHKKLQDGHCCFAVKNKFTDMYTIMNILSLSISG